jgi:glycosyltransferase involved in cell wall biosynthesis
MAVVSRNPCMRILQELSSVRFFLKNNNIQTIYSYFGFGLFGVNVRQIVGSADSNLYFPEINFWKSEKTYEKAIRWLIDKYRIFGLKIAAGVIFENKAMYERAEQLFGIEKKVLILPSIDVPRFDEELQIQSENNKPKVLLLCGWQRNKNILLIPKVAHKLRSWGVEVEFILTVARDDSSCSSEFFSQVKKWDVADLINCIGQVKKAQLPSLYKTVDLVLLLSLLESFSNNIIESWLYGRPLLVADELWSRALCADAAYYVQRDEVDKIAEAITNICTQQPVRELLISNGKRELSKYPSISERFSQEILFIREFNK